MSKIFILNWTNIKSALVVAILGAVAAVLINVVGTGSIFGLDWKGIANVGALSLFTGLIDLIKSLLTNNKGVIAGVSVK